MGSMMYTGQTMKPDDYVDWLMLYSDLSIFLFGEGSRLSQGPSAVPVFWTFSLTPSLQSRVRFYFLKPSPSWICPPRALPTASIARESITATSFYLQKQF